MKKGSFDQYLKEKLIADPNLQSELETIDRAIDVSFQIYALRERRGLTQAELAKLTDTNQSNIARLESADYTGYSLKTLEKIAKALNAELKISIIPEEEQNDISNFTVNLTVRDEMPTLDYWNCGVFALQSNPSNPTSFTGIDESLSLSNNSNKGNTEDIIERFQYAY